MSLLFMPLQTFVKTFFSVVDVTTRDIYEATFPAPLVFDGVVEHDMSGPLVSALNKYSAPCKFYISPQENEPKTRPDVWMVDLSRGPDSHIAQPPSPDQPATSVDRPFDWARCELTCDVKPSASDDAFAGETDRMLANQPTSARLTELISYFVELASRQHRVFVFQLLFFGTCARLVRWDRSTVIVSEKFDYCAEPHWLASVVWRYSRLGGELRGWDSSVSLAASADVALFKDALRRALQEGCPTGSESGATQTVYRALHTTNMAQATVCSDYPTYTVSVSDHKRKYATTLIIRRPFYEVREPFGRATRGYLAYDKAYRGFRFFKDAWRFDFTRSQDAPMDNGLSEEEFYEEAKDIPGLILPKVYYAGDVSYSPGQVQLALSVPPCDHQIHHRVLQELLFPLSSFQNSKELTCIMFDALKTLKVVYEEMNLVHKDISPGNVMARINDDGATEGVLNDWGNNGPPPGTHDTNPKPPFRVGTWQTMSIELFSSFNGRNLQRHDIESAALWVPLYTAFAHLGYTPRALTDLVLFGYPPDGEAPVPTPTQSVKMREWYLTTTHEPRPVFHSMPFTTLVSRIRSLYVDFYSCRAGAYSSAQEGRELSYTERDKLNKAYRQVDNINLIIEMFERALLWNEWPESDRRDDANVDQSDVVAFLGDECSLID